MVKLIHKRPILWIVVADSKQAVIYTRAPGKRLEVLHSLVHEINHHHRHELGRTFEARGNGRHAVVPHHDAKDIEHHVFAKELAATLHEASKSAAYDMVVLISPPKMLGEFRQCLSKSVQERILAELPKELTHLSAREIEAYLAEHSCL